MSMISMNQLNPKGIFFAGQKGVWALLATLFVGFAFMPLLAQEKATITGTVTDDATGDPIPGVSVNIINTVASTITDGNGRYSLKIKAGTHTVQATLVGFEPAKQEFSISAGGSTTLDLALKPGMATMGEHMVVLGSRSNRTAIETPVPVDVVAEEAIEETGFTELGQVLQFLAPSFNSQRNTISDGTDHVDPATLRGLGPDQVLVLINGKRRHTSALINVNGTVGKGTVGVDMNAIPKSAIQRVEVLRDGAAAQYGSDAIAGVINVVLKSRAEGLEVSGSGGATTHGDGQNIQFDAVYGASVGNGGSLTLTAEYRDREFTDRSGPDPRRQYPDGPEWDILEAQFDRQNHRYGNSDSTSAGVFLNFSYPLANESEVYAFGGVTARDGLAAGFYRRARDNRNVLEIYRDGFLPKIDTTIEDQSFSFGLKGIINEWQYDFSATTGSNSFDFNIRNTLNASLGPSSKTEFYSGGQRFGQSTLNADFVRFFGEETMPWIVAFGFEYRRDNFEQVAGEEGSYIDGGFLNQSGGPAAPGAQVFPGYRPSNELDESRNNVAAYLDIEKEWDRFLIGVAGRLEDYSDFGDEFSGKMALRYKISDNYALRGAVSTGFRAPSLHQRYFNSTSTQFVDVNGELLPLEVGTFNNASRIAQAFGIPSLKAETSVNSSLGFTAKPTENLSITLDGYQIDIDDRIVVTGQFRANSSPEIAAILEPFNVNVAQFFTNAIDTETKGVDAIVAWANHWAESSLSLTAAANFTETEVVGEVATPDQLADFGSVLFDRTERERFETGQPDHKINLSARYAVGPWSVLAKTTRFGETKEVPVAGDPSRDQVFSAKWITDLDLSFKLRDGLNFSVGGNNIFDVFPDKARSENNFNGIFQYSRRTAPFGFNGASFYGRFRYTF